VLDRGFFVRRRQLLNYSTKKKSAAVLGGKKTGWQADRQCFCIWRGLERSVGGWIALVLAGDGSIAVRRFPKRRGLIEGANVHLVDWQVLSGGDRRGARGRSAIFAHFQKDIQGRRRLVDVHSVQRDIVQRGRRPKKKKSRAFASDHRGRISAGTRGRGHSESVALGWRQKVLASRAPPAGNRRQRAWMDAKGHGTSRVKKPRARFIVGLHPNARNESVGLWWTRQNSSAILSCRAENRGKGGRGSSAR